MAGVPMLAFALGMYLPISINLPVLLGAFVAWIVSKTGKSKEVQTARGEQGVLIASGMMAGAAIFGILTAILRQVAIGAPIQYISLGERYWVEASKQGGALFLKSEEQAWYAGLTGQALSLGMYVLLAMACFMLAKKGADWALAEQKKQESAAPAERPPAETK
jgi:hypothetical protein